MGRYSEFVNTDEMRKARIDKGLTLYQMAELAGCSLSTMSNLETGGVKPDIESMTLVATILDRKVHELFNFGGVF